MANLCRRRRCVNVVGERDELSWTTELKRRIPSQHAAEGIRLEIRRARPYGVGYIRFEACMVLFAKRS
jgi:hypothetical protein